MQSSNRATRAHKQRSTISTQASTLLLAPVNMSQVTPLASSVSEDDEDNAEVQDLLLSPDQEVSILQYSNRHN